MKLSKYNFFYEKGNQCVVFNTFSNSIVILAKDEVRVLQNMEELTDEELRAYSEQGIIIEDNVDELAMMRFDNAYFAAAGGYHFRILTTTACNARCTYCYEKGTAIITMANEMVEKVVTFIQKTVTSNKPIRIEWFGGEPLVNMPVIQKICEKLTELGLPFESTMVTNGILLDDRIAKTLRDTCHLNKVQITLDGLADVYSAVKGVPQSCFDKVISNIVYLASNEITVHVRMNYNDNYDELLDLINYLGKELGFNKRIFYYIYPVFEGKESVSEEIMEKVLDLNDAFLRAELMKKSDLYKFTYRQTRCFATGYNSFTIAPDGKMYNCSHVLNDDGLIGTVESYSPYNANRIRFVDQNISKKCADCVLYPFCKGGCRAAELDEADLNQCVIYKNCIEAVLDRLLDI